MDTKLKYKEYITRAARGSREGAAKTSGFIPSDSAAAIYIDGGAGRGLRV